MILSEQAIADFKKAYFMDIGKKVNDEQAQELGIKLLEFFSLIYKEIPKDKLVTDKNIWKK